MAKKTRLMEISGRYGKENFIMNTSTIDGTLYMLCEAAEVEFGPKFIDSIASEIELTQTSYNRKKALEFLVNEFIKEHLAIKFLEISKKGVYTELRELKPLCEQTYVDYYVKLTTLERHTQGTLLEKACSNIPQMLSGYTTENPFPVCQTLVNYFKTLNNPEGLAQLIRKLSLKIKTDEEGWSR